MAKTDLTNQRQVLVKEYVHSGDHLEAAKNGGSILKPLFLETLYYQHFLRISNN